jgi:DNA polymerase-3 subunit gamma/tau
MMATTELHKIPDTVLSRAQVHEFRTIPARTVAERLRHIANEEHIEAPDEALMLLARAGEGSMRDSLSALDQVRAFAGDTITTEDVVTVLGLVGRDLVLDMIDAVVAEDAPAAFALTERAIERGYDLKLLCRELSRAMRDLLILSVDKSRAADPDVVGDADRERLLALVDRWSREDLLRGFDLLTRAEQEIRGSEQPRYSMEMALLRLMHLRKLTPLSELLAGGGGAPASASQPLGPLASPRMPVTRPMPSTTTRGPAPAPQAPLAPGPSPSRQASPPPPIAAPAAEAPGRSAVGWRDAFLAELKSAKPTFYNLVVAQAFRIDADESGVTFAFQPNQKVPKNQCEDNRAWLQSVVEKVAGARLPVQIVFTDASATPAPPAEDPVLPKTTPVSGERRKSALEHDTVRTLLEVFPVEKTTVQGE